MANENDIFQDNIIEAEENAASFLDENDELFDLLGMSEEEKQKASQSLREEDTRYEEGSVSEEDRLNNMLDGVSSDAVEQETGEMNASDESDTVKEQEETVDAAMATEAEDLLNAIGDISDMGDLSEALDTEETDDLDAAVQSLLQDMSADNQDAVEDNEEGVHNPEDALDAMAAEMNSSDTEKQDESLADDLLESLDGLDSLDSLDIPDEVMEGIDFDEDLTGASEEMSLEAEQPAEEETKWLKKKEQKEQKKEEKKKAKEAKKQAKQMAKEAAAMTAEMDKTEAEETNEAANAAIDEINLEQIVGGDEESVATAQEASDNLSFLQKLSLALFGPEEDMEPTPEEIAKMEEKQAEKEKKKEEKAQKKEAAQQEKALKKAQAKEMAVVKKAAAQDKKEQIRLEEEEEDAKERKFTSKQVGLVAAILALLACTVVIGTNQFNYHMVIARATNYFEMQKYRKAYEQIVGVDVKDRDQQIRDKIYCVMYVQQQIDSYNNFCKLEMYDNGLDSLIKGFRKYKKHYDEAKELGIEADLDRLQATIENELVNRYGLSVPMVEEWLNLDQTTYTQAIQNYVAAMQFE